MTDSLESPVGDSRWPHRVACILAGISFPLIWVGNLVTTTDAGMAVPDWPNTYGYNLFLYPYQEWFFGPWDLFVEHGHRLLATLAGVVSIILVVVCQKTERRQWVRMFAIALLGLVVFQGALGGIRVLYDARWFAKFHGCVGPAFFAATAAFCVVTSRWWKIAGNLSTARESRQTILGRAQSVGIQRNSNTVLELLVPRVAIAMLAISFLQLVLGAFIRHIDDSAAPGQFTFLVASHIVVAIAVVLGTFLQFLLTRQRLFRGVGIRASILVLLLLVVLQFCLGLGTWLVKFGWPIWFENQSWAAGFVVAEKSSFQINLVTAHAAVGSLILAFWTIHAVRANRLFRTWPAFLKSWTRGRSGAFILTRNVSKD